METRSKYSVIFNSTCLTWEQNRDINYMRLKMVENHANELLRKRGYVFLRDIYEILGIPVTKHTLFVGWFLDTSNSSGDGFIDFGIRFINETDCDIELDFNVDGNITKNFKD